VSEHSPNFAVRLARDPAGIAAAQRLRYEVFIEELGGDGAQVDHAARLERDRFDDVAAHLLLIDRAAGDRVAGTYRLLDGAAAEAAGGFYSASEYDLAPLLSGGRRLLELGRSCLHSDYRGTAGMYHLWSALAEHVRQTGVEVLFGTASFHGTDVAALSQPLAYLHHHHLAPEALRVRARPPEAVSLDLIAKDRIDRRAALLQVPALIKAYLRLGGAIGEGGWIDRAFNTVDVCLVLDTARMNDRTARLYAREGAEG